MPNKKVILYSPVTLWNEHNPEIVELALKNLHDGNDVVFISCDGDLAACPPNPEHSKDLCAKCVKQQRYVFEVVLKKQARNVALRLSKNKMFTAARSINSLEDLLKIKHKNVAIGAMVASELVDRYRDSYLDLKTVEKDSPGLVVDLLTTAKNLYDFTEQLIKEENPNQVYVWNGRRFCDGPVAWAAKHNGSTPFIFCSGDYGRYVSAEGTSIQSLDLAKKSLNQKILKSESSEEEIRIFAESFYTKMDGSEQADPKSKLPYGYVAYNNYDRSNGVLLKNYLLILTSSNWEFFGHPEWEDTPFLPQIPAIENIAEMSTEQGRNVVVRWHPAGLSCGNGEKQQIESLIERTSSENVIHYPSNNRINTFDLIKNASVVIVFGSTTAMYANYHKIPVILLGRAHYEELGGCYRPKNWLEFHKIITTQTIRPMSSAAALKYAAGHAIASGEKYRFVELKESSGEYYYDNRPLVNMTLKGKIKRNILVALRKLSVLRTLGKKYVR